MLCDGLYTYAAAFAAIAQSIKAVEAKILKPGGLHMTSLMFGFYQVKSLFPANATAGLGIVVQDKIDKKAAR